MRKNRWFDVNSALDWAEAHGVKIGNRVAELPKDCGMTVLALGDFLRGLGWRVYKWGTAPVSIFVS